MFGVAAFRSEPVEYGGFVLAMIAMLLAVCYAKGERPRWSWGDHRR